MKLITPKELDAAWNAVSDAIAEILDYILITAAIGILAGLSGIVALYKTTTGRLLVVLAILIWIILNDTAPK